MRALVDPILDQLDLLGGKGIFLVGHAADFIVTGADGAEECLIEEALIRLLREILAFVFAGAEGFFLGGDVELSLGFFALGIGAVTLHAGGFEDRLNVLYEIDLRFLSCPRWLREHQSAAADCQSANQYDPRLFAHAAIPFKNKPLSRALYQDTHRGGTLSQSAFRRRATAIACKHLAGRS